MRPEPGIEVEHDERAGGRATSSKMSPSTAVTVKSGAGTCSGRWLRQTCPPWASIRHGKSKCLMLFGARLADGTAKSGKYHSLRKLGLALCAPEIHITRLSRSPLTCTLTAILAQMNYGEYELDLSDSPQRPMKRPRSLKDGDDGHRPYIPMSASPGAQPELDTAGETATKKSARKRPLSCGECRR